MDEVIIYTKDYCGFCAQAKALLDAKGVTFTEIDVTHDPAVEAEMIERSGRRTVPQTFIDGRHIGGFDDLTALDAAGRLNPLLGHAKIHSKTPWALGTVFPSTPPLRAGP